MLKILVPATEMYNEETNEFLTTKACELHLEHSLVSLSKWESKWKIPFLSSNKTLEQELDYIRCMTITQNVDPLVYFCLTEENQRAIRDYINDPMTATTIQNHERSSRSNKVITAEVIYYWMGSYGIPVEFQKWHLNRLLTLIEVYSIESNPKKKKRSTSDVLAQQRALNEARRAKYGTRG